ncbi:argininosuccinate synthase [Chitinophaga terrae (ex Kim and Jung 2007)]|jgi:argininosuccinate synthase|uniref:argininosuccinate synthase n=1 Tax=Chitinophaga terrae (ex Kim and Jung 2007) TaxID=408074 RepID=A0A1H4E4G8_9BACT|nr:argininosuccinate synthase domain-containing protein [Chitinophaga terrae (ex Kim and Jung 2007)]MDQ0108254.1 argininosuccinate synthase [Chitinophaga terrae (ex Kim and Jung 2007)]GEP91441.1 argininosuccinate synthase [Chitinophaga terrae (ex Kim and Jung 2007)]SEA79262.1 argininosuccinate synthase [Chitinophaga terrae (ex Kim and Jung 2007)]
MKKVVLGFSGGLDTSYCVKYLTEEKGYEVHSVIVNTGGFSEEELQEIERRAYNLGVKSHKTVNAIHSYYDGVIKYLIFGNVLKNNTYPLSVSAERMSQALAIAEYVKEVGADAVAHGSTGAGNDQVRFDMVFHIMIPGVEIITPIRDMKLSREEEISYLKSKGVQMNFDKAVYSINKGLWGTSVGGKETLTSNGMLPEEAWPTQLTKQGEEQVKLVFTKGELTGVNDKTFDHPSAAIQYLQTIAGPFAIGRDIHVGDTIIGIKGRVGFEAAAPMVIIKAHHALEKHVLTKWQLTWKDQLAQFYGNYMHEGQIMDPVMRDIEAFLQHTQENVTGEVYVTLMPYRFQVTGIQSPYDLMSSKFGKYGEMNSGWSGEDVRGFSKIFGNQTMIWHQVKNSI